MTNIIDVTKPAATCGRLKARFKIWPKCLASILITATGSSLKSGQRCLNRLMKKLSSDSNLCESGTSESSVSSNWVEREVRGRSTRELTFIASSLFQAVVNVGGENLTLRLC